MPLVNDASRAPAVGYYNSKLPKEFEKVRSEFFHCLIFQSDCDSIGGGGSRARQAKTIRSVQTDELDAMIMRPSV